MCSMSAVSDYYMRDRQPNYGGGLHLMPQIMQDPETKELLRKALELLDRVDKRLGDVECTDETKAAFLKIVGDGGTVLERDI